MTSKQRIRLASALFVQLRATGALTWGGRGGWKRSPNGSEQPQTLRREGTFYMAPKNCSICPAILVIQRARHGATALRLTVHNSGPGIALGIALKDLGHIFEPLYTTNREGLGMGLAIVRTIVNAHGGAVAAANNPQGGASLHVTLSVAPEIAR